MAIRFMANLREGLRASELQKDGSAILGAIAPMAIGTALDLSGWKGWLASYGSVYIVAKGLGYDNTARGAAAVAVAHLGWTVGTPYFEKIFGRAPWRMGLGNSVTAMSGCSDCSMMDEVTSGETVATLPQNIVSYPSSEMSNSVTAMSNSVTSMSNSYSSLSNSVTSMSENYGMMPVGRNSPMLNGR